MPGALFIIASDPRISPRPAEAVRIAAGLAAWQRVRVTVYLRGPAVLALSEFPEDLIDADHFRDYLPGLQADARLFAQAGAPELDDLDDSPWEWEAVDDQRLAELAVNHESVLRF
jgi:hypothetical protein